MLLENRGKFNKSVCVWWPVSPVRVQQRGCRSSPTPQLSSDWKLLQSEWCCLLPCRRSPSLLPSLLSQWTLSHLDEARTSLWLCGADRLTNDREEGGAEGESEEGIEEREGRILCNGVENTKERQTHAFVIFVSLHPPTPHPPHPPSLSLVPCLSFCSRFKPCLFDLQGQCGEHLLNSHRQNIYSLCYLYYACC